MTFAEKVEQIRQNRSIALSSRVNVSVSQNDTIEENNFNNKFLWGEGSEIGIQQLIKLYYEERNLERGRNYTSPSIANYNKTNWDARLNAALDVYGDGADGFYPPDVNGIAAETMNYATPWLNDNDDDGTINSGIEALINDVDNAIGEDASDNSNNRTDGPYATINEAIAAGNARAIADAGSGLKGKRTENNEVTTSGSAPDVYYFVGSGGVDDSTYHADPEKQELLDAIDALINALDSSSPYRAKLTEIYNEVDDIKTETNQIFAEPNMDADVDDDRPAITALTSNLDGWVGVNTDTVTNGTLWGYRNYFAGSVGADGNYDTYITALETLVDTTIKNALITRFNNVDTILGNGTPTFTKLKKWRSFWIGTMILKPMASLITLNAMQFANDNAYDNLKIADDQLVILFGSQYEKYIPTPKIITCFPKHKRDEETSAITQYRIGIAFIGQSHATEYLIYRRLISNTIIDNADWGDTPYATFTDTNPDTGLIKIVYIDDNANLNTGQKFCYRIRTRDTQITAPHDNYLAQATGSIESKIYDDTKEKSFTSITNSKINLGEDHGISAGKYVVIKNSATSNGFYYVLKVNDEVITISPSISVEGPGKLYPTNSIIFI